MICPLYKGECNLARCHDNGRCMPAPADNLASPPPPTLAEIENTLDAFECAAREFVISSSAVTHSKMLEARAALMAAIRAYGRE